jgi:prepilin-type N-terminal cleavage/methylation domain-containing protein
MRATSQRGVTLIELVIAISLVALLSVGMLFAMRVGLKAMERSNAVLMANRRVMSVQRILEGQVANLMPVPALCGLGADAPQSKIGFFEGEFQSLRFVSSYSLHEGDRGLPHILEFQVIGGEEDVGVRLVVNERVYTGPLSTGALCLGVPPGAPTATFRPIEIGPLSFVLADKIAYCRFAYKEHLPPYGEGQWLARWNKPYFPVAIRVEMSPLNPGAGHLQLVTLTMPVHVNRDPLGHYEY